MNKQKLLSIALTIFSTIFLCGNLFGQTAQQQIDIAEISNNGSNVSWVIKVSYESATLTVSTPNGKTFRRVFKAGTNPSFSPANSGGEYLGDGRFNYEIVLTPVLSASVKQALAQSRIDGTSDAVREDFMKRGIIPQKTAVSGTFAFENGNLVTASDLDKEPETTGKSDVAKIEPTTKTDTEGVPVENTVITDDLIVQGSTCTGFDCVNGESFGFDTLRLKENNLRLHFDDTSNTASFPANDWRIVANDTSNGGASYLAFEDSTAGNRPFTVFAGAGSNALVVDDDGQVGLGTSTPVVELHIVDGDSPTMRLEQNGSSGFTPQTWDIAGNETNFFIRDVSSGSTLPFRIQPGASSGTVNIGTSGNVGIGFGTNNFSTNPLEVRNNNTTQLAIVNTSGELHLPLTGGGIRFPDGTVQTTATSGTGFGETNTGSNVGSGGVGVFVSKVGTDLQFRNITAGANVTVTQSGNNIEIASTTVPPLGSIYATAVFGGSGTYIPANSTITHTVDTNSFGAGTTGAGYANLLYNIPTNPNLVDAAGTNTVIRVRYRDSDGAGTGANVFLSKVTINTSGGTRTTDTILNSNTEAGTGFQTVTVCKPASYFNFSTLGNHLNVILSSSAGTNADIVFVQIYKSTTCP